MDQAEAFVYCWTDHAANKLYIGFHKGSPDDGYVCSSRRMMPIYKNDPGRFTRAIIAQGTVEDCYALERSILRKVDAAHSVDFYNKWNDTFPVHVPYDTSNMSMEDRLARAKKISSTRMNASPEKKAAQSKRYSEANKKRWAKMSPEERKNKLARSHAANRGTTRSDAVKEKLRKIHRNRFSDMTDQQKRDWVCHIGHMKTKLPEHD